MLKLKPTVLVIVGVLAAGAAKADVVYTFMGTGPSPGSYGGFVFTPALDLTLDISNAAVQRGSFTLQGQGTSSDPSQDYTGDLADWISFSSTSMPSVGKGIAPTMGQFRLALTFDPNTSAVTSTSFESAFEETGDSTLSGVGSVASGTVSNDYPAYALCDPRTNACSVAGIWQSNAVPEPLSFAVLGSGLIGLAGMRRRHTVCSTGEA